MIGSVLKGFSLPPKIFAEKYRVGKEFAKKFAIPVVEPAISVLKHPTVPIEHLLSKILLIKNLRCLKKFSF